MKMKPFKLRAECMIDVIRLAQSLGDSAEFLAVEQLYKLPDVEVTLRAYSLDSILVACRAVEDGHVMLQTARPLREYTGERDYGIE